MKKRITVLMIILFLSCILLITLLLSKNNFKKYYLNHQNEIETLAASLADSFNAESRISITANDIRNEDTFGNYVFYDLLGHILLKTTCHRIVISNLENFSMVAFHFENQEKNESSYLLYVDSESKVSVEHVKTLVNEAFLRDVRQIDECWFEIIVFVPTSDNTGD